MNTANSRPQLLKPNDPPEEALGGARVQRQTAAQAAAAHVIQSYIGILDGTNETLTKRLVEAEEQAEIALAEAVAHTQAAAQIRIRIKLSETFAQVKEPSS